MTVAQPSPRPTTRDEDWRYADGAALARLDPAELAEWKDIALAPGEVRRRHMTVGGSAPELHRIRLDVAAGARAELFVLVAGQDYTRLEIAVQLGAGAHFEFGGVTIGGGCNWRPCARSSPGWSTPARRRAAIRWCAACTGGRQPAISSAGWMSPATVSRPMRRRITRACCWKPGQAANARPELEIFADDVKCAHGAADRPAGRSRRLLHGRARIAAGVSAPLAGAGLHRRCFRRNGG